MIILAGTKPEHLNMLEGGIIAKLLQEKWMTFAKVSFTILYPLTSIIILINITFKHILTH